MSPLKLILNEQLPSDLRAILDRTAQEEDITVNDAASRVLAEHYRVSWDPSGYSYRPVAERFKLRVSDELHRKIRLEAADRMLTIRGLALHALSSHFGTTIVSPDRRPRKRREE